MSSIFQFWWPWATFRTNFLITKVTYDINKFRILMLGSGLNIFSQDILVYIYGHNFFSISLQPFPLYSLLNEFVHLGYLCIWGTYTCMLVCWFHRICNCNSLLSHDVIVTRFLRLFSSSDETKTSSTIRPWFTGTH